jgi:hypothetical protein
MRIAHDFAPFDDVSCGSAGAHASSLHNRIDRLEVAWIRREPNFHLSAAFRLAQGHVAEVVLDVAVSATVFGM